MSSSDTQGHENVSKGAVVRIQAPIVFCVKMGFGSAAVGRGTGAEAWRTHRQQLTCAQRLLRGEFFFESRISARPRHCIPQLLHQQRASARIAIAL